nr:hypothetical protein [Tanacetum cinerariifolium]
MQANISLIKGMTTEMLQAFKGTYKEACTASRSVCQDLDEPIRIPYEIHGKIYNLANDEIQEYLNKEKEIKKKAEEAKLLEMSKSKPIKVVQEEAAKAGVDPKILASAKGSQEFKKIQDVELKVLNKEHSQKVKRQIELKKKRLEQYMWTTSSRLKPEPITDVTIHPNTKPTVLTVYKGNHKRNFEVHNAFKFADFGVIELDE